MTNSQKEIQRIIEFIRRTTHAAKFNKVIIPLSGGIDSSVVTFLAARALGVEAVLIAKLPYKNQDKDADLIIDKLAIPKENIFEIDIKPTVDLLFEPLDSARGKRSRELLDSAARWRLHSKNKIRLGNIMARIRMTILYDLAKANHCLVCGTENKSEYSLGYYTLHGDSASDLEPIRHLYKTEVRELAEYLGIPQRIIDKPPTANLWPGQTDENELGFSYTDADQILNLYFDQKKPVEEIINQGFEKSLVEKVINQVKANSFKEKLPYLIS